MIKAKLTALGVVASLGLMVVATGAAANKKHHHHHDDWDDHHHHGHHHHHHHHDWENYRDARRAGILAGTAATGIAGAVAEDNAKNKYEECMDSYYNDPSYDQYCRQQYYEDERRAERAARRTGVVTGLAVREIVRD